MKHTETVIRISELKLRPDHSNSDLEAEIRKELRLKNESFQYEIMRRSIDARKKPEIRYVYTVDVTIQKPGSVLKRVKNKKVLLTEKPVYVFPCSEPENSGQEQGSQESGSMPHAVKGQKAPAPVVVGSGPAGLFCTLMLARAGKKPVLIERGEPVEDRVQSVQSFWETGKLDPQSNVQFGEGGAGTFSDGKLNTLIKDPEGKIRFVLKEFVMAGADPSILYDHKPHIGTDVLVKVVKNLREEIIREGGSVRFRTCLTGIRTNTDAGPRYSLELNGGEEYLETDELVLAIGHSARDTFEMLYRSEFPMQAKAFAVGLRMEHPQKLINDDMYGTDCTYELGAAPYKVTHKCEDGRGVYSFCMCPGGYVVNASSEPGRLAVNGMSYSGRNSENANSAIVVTVTPEDYQADHPLSGLRFQRDLEEKAWKLGQGSIPVQRFGDFCGASVPNAEKTAETAAGKDSESDTDGARGREAELQRYYEHMHPEMKGAFRFADVRSLLPEELNQSLIEGIHAFGKKIRGFDSADALLSGVESRTSSPVRIPRGENGQIDGYPGIFPCGEGAGYAGGITSAAVDGIRIAEAVCRADDQA